MKIELPERIFVTDANECFFDMLCRKGTLRKIPKDSIQNSNGCYVFFGWDDYPIRVGKAVKLRNRILQYVRDRDFIWENEIQFVGVLYTENNTESVRIEDMLIKHIQPKYNKVGL